ncbi:MAG TPA: hypothetical protein DEO88_16535 [Syntrophobacteraceae bacterium]|nr:hypothetical protein [Syntrophobacteraceae bacterium]
MKNAIVLTTAVLSQAAGNTILSKGMKGFAAASRAQGDAGPLWMAGELLGNPFVCLGTVLLIVFFVLFSAALSWEDLSFVVPVTSMGYVLSLVFANQFLQETISAARWSGTVLISLGVLLVAKSGARKAPSRQDESPMNPPG